MKAKVSIGKRLNLNKEKLNKLNEEQLNSLLGGRMAAATSYTAGDGKCSKDSSSCCSVGQSSCCG